jgi:ubiquinone/menaquinone biosynthesis C-methylase UbiE
MNLKEIRKAYENGENITQLLQNKGVNSLEVIEMSYDLQAGSYSDHALSDSKWMKDYCNEIGGMLKPHIRDLDIVLDCGTGEMTSLSGISHHLPEAVELLAFDISLSRIRAGREYVERAMRSGLAWKLRPFVASMDRIPLLDYSIDVVITVHAMEPNHCREEELLRELFRVSRRKVILFEPSWEENSEQGKERMRSLGYIRGLPECIRRLGGVLESCTPLQNVANHLNPTFCYVINLEKENKSRREVRTPFACPSSGTKLFRHNGFFWSEEGGYAYPIIDGIPILRKQAGILMTRRP